MPAPTLPFVTSNRDRGDRQALPRSEVPLHCKIASHTAHMKESFLLASNALADVLLRTAAPSDCEDLRAWKNEHRRFFFFQEIITAERQRQWFEGYQARADDFMFVVLERGEAVGCMG